MDIDDMSRVDLIGILRNVESNNIQIIDRDKNYEFQFEHNLTIDEIHQEIKKLSVEDIWKGPLKDDNPNRDHPVWIFKKIIWDIRCYIKIKIINKGKIVIVISFHEDE